MNATTAIFLAVYVCAVISASLAAVFAVAWAREKRRRVAAERHLFAIRAFHAVRAARAGGEREKLATVTPIRRDRH